MDVSVASRRMVSRLAVMLAAVLVSGVVFAAPASAGATNCDWGSGQVCLYKNSSYATGGIERRTGSDRHYSIFDKFDHCWWYCLINDSISSIKNRGNSMNTAHYKHKDYGGYEFRLYRNTQKDLWGDPANDELSSHQWVWW